MLLKTVRIESLVETSLLDWPGRLATVIFLPGCNLRCRYCHARDLILGARRGESIPLDDVLQMLAGQEGWLDGVVVSGGEPTLCPGLPRLCEEIKRRGFAVKLDTNGTRPPVLRRLIEDGLVDAIAMDVKAPLDPDKYATAAGVPVDIAAIRESILTLIRSDIEYEFRTTFCPRIHSGDDILQIAEDLRGARRYILQIFRPTRCLDPAFEHVHPPSREELVMLASKAARFVLQCSVRGESAPQVEGSRSK